MASNDYTIRIWDIPTGKANVQLLKNHKGGVTSMAHSPDGTKLVSGGGYGDYSIIIWDTQTNSATLGPLHGHTSAVRSVTFSPDGTRIVSGSEDGTIRIWDVLKNSKRPAIDHSLRTPVGPIAFSPDCARFISASSTGVLHTWDMHIGKATPPTFQGIEDLKPIRSVAISPQGKHVAAASDQVVRVWDALTGAIVPQRLAGHTGPIQCLTFSPDGASICSGSDDSTLIAWNMKTMIGRRGRPYRGHTGSVHSVTYSPDGAHIASGATDKTVRVWNPATGLLTHTLKGFDGSVESVAFSPDGRHIISGCDDGKIRRWDLNGKYAANYTTRFSDLDATAPSEPPEYYDCHNPIDSMAFSHNGTRIVTGSGSTIRVFNSQITKVFSELSLPDGERIHWIGFSSDGNNIISISTSEQEHTKRSTKHANQRTSQPPNIIRLWRTGTQFDQEDLVSRTGYWSLERDGRVLSPEGLVTWVPPDIIPYLGCDVSESSRAYYNPFVLSPEGVIDLGYNDLCVGERWAECYNYKD